MLKAPLIGATIRPSKLPLPGFQAFIELSFIYISAYPLLHPYVMVLVLVPFPGVCRSIGVGVDALPLRFPILPITFIHFAFWVYHPSMSIECIIKPIPKVYRPIIVVLYPFPPTQPPIPLPYINSVIIDELSRRKEFFLVGKGVLPC